MQNTLESKKKHGWNKYTNFLLLSPSLKTSTGNPDNHQSSRCKQATTRNVSVVIGKM